MTRLFMTTDAVGGVWNYSVALAGELVRTGAEVQLGVIGPAPTPDRAAAAEALGIDLVSVDAPLDWLAGDPGTLAEGRAAIVEAAEAYDPGIVHLNQPAYAGGDWPVPLVTAAHSCVETWWRGTHGRPAPAEWAWHVEAVSEGLRNSTVAVAPSRSFAVMLHRTYKLSHAPIAVLNGTWAAEAETAEKGSFALASGRVWDPSKNFPVLDAAARSIRWPVQVAGDRTAPDGSCSELPRHFRCLGRLSPQAMGEKYAAAPIYVSPSLCEPFGLGVLEAAQAGAALVLSDIDTFRELWDGAALFFEPRDPDALAAAVNRLISGPILRRRMADAARRQAARYLIAATAQRMRQLYALAAPERTKVPA